jgi:hypothetical protein
MLAVTEKENLRSCAPLEHSTEGVPVMTSDARSVALEYMKAFEVKDKDSARSYLHSDGLYKGPLKSFQNADAFVKEMSVFMYIARNVRIKKVLADDTDVCIIWDYETVIPSIPITPIAQWFRIDNGKIRELHVHFNPVPFIAAMEKGEIEEALKSARQK